MDSNDDANEFERNQIAQDEALEVVEAETPAEDRRSHMAVIAATCISNGWRARIEGDFVGVYNASGYPVSCHAVARVLDADGIDDGMVSCEQRGRWVAVRVL